MSYKQSRSKRLAGKKSSEENHLVALSKSLEMEIMSKQGAIYHPLARLPTRRYKVSAHDRIIKIQNFSAGLAKLRSTRELKLSLDLPLKGTGKFYEMNSNEGLLSLESLKVVHANIGFQSCRNPRYPHIGEHCKRALTV